MFQVSKQEKVVIFLLLLGTLLVLSTLSREVLADVHTETDKVLSSLDFLC